ncbi:MAG: mevalonate kinase [Gammaproteobacteria bacterium]|nr:mevalonate kinase [Gammaproteobacteria bacterium]
MDSVSYKVSAPGSLMLLGEHAVLYRKQAIVTAINHRIKVSLTPRSDYKINIVSSSFGNHLVSLNKFKIIRPYDYVLTAIKKYLNKIDCGFTLNIYADFSSNVGFGSSAAVTVATLGVLHQWLSQKNIDYMALYRQAVSVVNLVQGSGSGADVAASVFGGVLAYKREPIVIKKINDSLPLVAVYSGSKVATAEVIKIVAASRKRFPKVFASIYNAIDSCAQEASVAIKNNDWSRLGELINIHQGLHDALGVNNTMLSELVFSLRNKPHIYGAKISGSGLGDSVIGLGKVKKDGFPENKIQKKYGVKQIDVAVSPTGFVYEA